MKKNIILYPYYGKNFLDDKVFKVDNGTNIFFGLDNKLQKRGVQIHTYDKKNTSADKYFYCDVPYPWEIAKWFGIWSHIDKNILLCFESPIINPFSQLRFLRYLFNKIYTWNDDLVDNKNFYKFYIPQLKSVTINNVAYERKKFIVFVSNNKYSNILLRFFSGWKRDLYEERRKVVSFFESYSQIDVYGKGWGKTGKGYLDPSKDGKIKLLSKYKYCICFENTRASGYVTEKIFDCFKARVIPVYFGATNIGKYINSGAFIDFEKFKSYELLLEYLNNLSEKDYNKILRNGRNVLKDKKIVKNFFEPELYFLRNLS